MPTKGLVKKCRERDGIAAFAVTDKGFRLAVELRSAYAGISVFGPSYPGRDGLKSAFKDAFTRVKAIIFIGATGIAVRLSAPLLKGKDKDPAVVVMDEAGRFAISLLSGHLGGANRLAQDISAICGATPVITTATDSYGLACAEDMARAFLLEVEDAGRIKRVNSAILKGSVVPVIDRDRGRLGKMREMFEGKGPFRFLSRFPASGTFEAAILVTPFEAFDAPKDIRDRVLVLRPREFVLGIGCGKGANLSEVRLAVLSALEKSGVSPLALKSVATIDIKKNEKGISRFASSMGLGVSYFSSEELGKVRPPSGRSAKVMEATGTGSVCESACLKEAGVKGIWLKKFKKGRVAVAMARAPFTS